MPIMPAMTNPLKKWRDDLKLTQPEAAELLDIDGMTLSRWERGENFPRKKNWPKIQEVTGITPARLVEHMQSVNVEGAQ